MPRIATFLIVVTSFIAWTVWYPPLRLWQLVTGSGAPHWIVVLALSVLTVFAIRQSIRLQNRALRLFLYYWLTSSFILASLVTVYELIRLVAPIDDRLAAGALLLGTAILVVVSVQNARRVVVTRHTIHSAKLSRPERVVQLSDLHIGSRTPAFLADVVALTNALHADHVVITGDLIDSRSRAEGNLRALEQLDAPTWFVSGNHDRYEGLDWLVPEVENMNIRVLRDRAESAGQLHFLGIDDADDPKHVTEVLPQLPRQPDRYEVLLYHRPSGWQHALDDGIDLMLSGHTHHGQIVPFNWLVRTRFNPTRGLHRRSGGTLYVSTGTGTWGPTMRLGSRCEIVCFELLPE